MKTLDTLKEGEQAQITEIAGDDAVTVRLMEMGLTAGETIELIGFAPMGDPIEFLIRGYRISLRKNEAQRVRIDSDQPQHSESESVKNTG